MPTPYANRSGLSNVVSFDFDPANPTWIEVTFASGRWTVYRYDAASAGLANVQRMISLAQAGQGLNSFIGRVVKGGYASKR